MVSGKLIRSLAKRFFSREQLDRKSLEIHWSRAERIAVAALSGIGDAIMATPLLYALRAAKPKAEITLITAPPIAPLLNDAGIADDIIVLDRGSWTSVITSRALLSNLHPDIFLAAQPFNTLKHSWIAIFSGGAVRVKAKRNYPGEEWRDYGFLYSAMVPDTPGRHRVELNLDLLRIFGVEIPEKSVRPVVVFEHEEDSGKEILRDKAKERPVIALHPGGLRPEKQWGAEQFAETCRAVAAERDVLFVMLGAENDMMHCQEIMARTEQLEWIDMSGKRSLKETGRMLAECDVLLCNDTGIMHLATAVGTPVVAVFGPTDPARIGPYNENAIVLRGDPISSVEPGDVARNVIATLH